MTITIDQDNLIAYALGILSEEEASLVGRHLRMHPDDVLELKGYLNALTAIVMSEQPEAVPENAELSLLERIRSKNKGENKAKKIIQFSSKDSSQGVNKWWLGLASAAIIASILWFGFLQDSYNNYLINNELKSAQQKEGAISQTLVSEANEIIGTLVKHNDNSLLVVFNKNPLFPQVYQAWEIIEGVPKSLGIWKSRVIHLDSLTENSIFGVTVEPQGGSLQPTNTPIVLFEL